MLLLNFVLLYFISTTVSAQLIHYSELPSQKCQLQNLSSEDFSFHSAIKPYYLEDIKKIILFDSLGLLKSNQRIIITGKKGSDNQIFLSLLGDAIPLLIPKETNKFGGEYSYGINSELSFSGKNPEKNSNLFNFSLTCIFNHSLFPDYLQEYISRTHVLRGQGYAHSVDWGYRYNNLSFYSAKTVGKHFVFEGGFGKNFFGDGHRSLFLSDVASNYPYLKITTTVWKLKYVNLYANFKDISAGYENWFSAKNKYGAFHFLSWNVTKRLNINLFEAVIWTNKTVGHTRGFDVNYLNPIVFYRPTEFSLGSPDNVLIGLGTQYKIGKNQMVYCQLLLDEFLLKEVMAGFRHIINPKDTSIIYGSWFNKQAIQAGYKYFNVAGIKNLNFLTEFNYVRPYTYSHRDVSENYGHFNEPLAHPLGANFWESVSILHYTYRKWFFETEFLHYLTGLDSSGTHFGQDIYKPTYDTYMPDVGNVIVKQYGNKIGQGICTTINFYSFKASYLILAKMNFRVEAGYIYRLQNSKLESKSTNYFYLGIRTSLVNKVYDF